MIYIRYNIFLYLSKISQYLQNFTSIIDLETFGILFSLIIIYRY
jgi:hypothetical protein